MSPEINLDKIKKLFEGFGEVDEIKISTILRENSRVKFAFFPFFQIKLKKIPKIICYLAFKNVENAVKAKSEMDKKMFYDVIFNVR